jgi:hypothetical protein
MTANPPRTAAQPGTSGSLLRATVILAWLGTCGLAFVLGRTLGTKSGQPMRSPAPSVTSDLAAFRGRAGAIAPGRPPVKLVAIKAADDAPERATALVAGLLAATESFPAFMQGNPEGTAVDMNDYLRGWSDAIGRSDRGTMREAADELTNRLCGAKLQPDHLMVLARIGRFVPALLTDRGLDCGFKQLEREDVVLWELMDAWRISGLPAPPSLQRLTQGASDPRTKRRMQSLEEETLARAPPPQAPVPPASPAGPTPQ